MVGIDGAFLGLPRRVLGSSFCVCCVVDGVLRGKFMVGQMQRRAQKTRC